MGEVGASAGAGAGLTGSPDAPATPTAMPHAPTATISRLMVRPFHSVSNSEPLHPTRQPRRGTTTRPEMTNHRPPNHSTGPENPHALVGLLDLDPPNSRAQPAQPEPAGV